MLGGKSHNEYAHSKMKLHVARNKGRVHSILQWCSLLISLVTIVSVTCYHGLYISLQWKKIISGIIYGSLIFYILKYVLFFIYSLHRKQYLRKSWLEGLIILFLLFQFLSIYVFHFDWKIFNSNNFENYYLLFIQFYFLIIVVIELAKINPLLGKINISPPGLMVGSFLILIVVGTILLLMPRMTTNGISFIDALFTATSASCITGLSVLSTSACFTVKGQVVIMILIQLGGMSILSFATFFTTFLARSSVGLRYQYMVRDMMSTSRLSDSVSLLRSIVLTTFVIELTGAALLFTYWKTIGFFPSNNQNLLYSVFYTISAFNNGGFVLKDTSLLHMGVESNYFPQVVIMILVFLGGIGFPTIRDFFGIKNIRERNRHHWKKLQYQTKIVLVTTFWIILIGTVLFFLIERNNALRYQTSLFDKVFTSLFQIITCRTSGFLILDVNTMRLSSIIMILLILFIGGSPASTAGGVKTTTMFVIIKSIIATIKGKDRIEYDHRTISFSLVDKATSVVLLSLGFIMISCFAITLVQPDVQLLHAIFETTSAFTTCGLSTGKCADWNWMAKLVLVGNMYIGRIGTLTLAFALTKRKKDSPHQYPDLDVMVG